MPRFADVWRRKRGRNQDRDAFRQEATYFVTLSTEKQEDGTDKKTQQLTCYLPAVRSLSVLITLSLQVNDELPPLPDEEVLALAEPFAAAITFAEK